jgi:hypothetical protein
MTSNHSLFEFLPQPQRIQRRQRIRFQIVFYVLRLLFEREKLQLILLSITLSTLRSLFSVTELYEFSEIKI